MDKRTMLGRTAMRGAFDTRKRVGLTYDVPVCVYGIVEKLGVSLWLQGGGSFGGMYVKSANAIFVPSLRPAPRQAFTCAHELGHWYYGHGSKLDAYKENVDCGERDDEERLADLFAGHLLMPPKAVAKAFNVRKISADACSPIDFFRVVSQLGVGYTTLLSHMRWTQQSIGQASYEQLMRSSPKKIRSELLGFLDSDPGHLVLVDEQWGDIPVDLQVGQVAIVPPNTIVRGANIVVVRKTNFETVVRAESPGISAIGCQNGWSSFVRVSRRNFEGRSIYRHLEEVEDE